MWCVGVGKWKVRVKFVGEGILVGIEIVLGVIEGGVESVRVGVCDCV